MYKTNFTLAFCLLLILTISYLKPSASSAEVDVGLDFSTNFHSLADDDLTGQPERSPGVGPPALNLYLSNRISKNISLNTEIHGKTNSKKSVYMKEAFVKFLPDTAQVQFEGMFKLSSIKLGTFEIDYGNLHSYRSDNAEVQNNFFVGNHIFEPVAVQNGIEINLQVDKFNNFVFSLTDGGANGALKPGDGLSIASKLKSKIGKFGRYSFSYYYADHSENPNSRSNLFSDVSHEPYPVIKNFGGNCTSSGGTHWCMVSLDGNHINAIHTDIRFLLDEYMAEIALGTAKDKMGTPLGENDEISYGSLSFVSQPAKNFYYGFRSSYVEGSKWAGEDIDARARRTQLIFGKYLNKKTLTKLEFVQQKEFGSATDQDEFNGIVWELSISI